MGWGKRVHPVLFFARPDWYLGLGPLPRAQMQGLRQRFFLPFSKKILCRGLQIWPSAKTSFAEGLA